MIVQGTVMDNNYRLKKLQAANKQMEGTISALNAEVERLRAAYDILSERYTTDTTALREQLAAKPTITSTPKPRGRKRTK